MADPDDAAPAPEDDVPAAPTPKTPTEILDPYGDDSQDDQYVSDSDLDEEDDDALAAAEALMARAADKGRRPSKVFEPPARAPAPAKPEATNAAPPRATPRAAAPKAAAPKAETDGYEDDTEPVSPKAKKTDGYSDDDDFAEKPHPRRPRQATKPITIGTMTFSVEQAKLMRVADAEELMARCERVLKKESGAKISAASIHYLAEPHATKLTDFQYGKERRLRAALADEEKEKVKKEAEAAGVGGLTGSSGKARLSEQERARLVRRAKHEGIAEDAYLPHRSGNVDHELKKRDGWMREEDKRECTFQPRTATAASIRAMQDCGYEFARDAGAPPKEGRRDQFVERLTRNERFRRRALEAAIGAAAYKDRLDKKCCPICGTVQSYDEWVERYGKGRNCQECSVPYKAKRPAGSKGLDAWLERQDAEERDRRARRTRAALEREREQQRRMVGAPDASGKRSGDAYQRALRAKVDAEGGPFLSRLADDVRRRREATARRAETKNAETHSFTPAMPGLKASNKQPAPVVAKWEDDLETFLKKTADRRERAVGPSKKKAPDDPAPKRPTARKPKRKAPKERDVDLGKFDKLVA